jgi:creatinine amidohydrolase
MKLSNITAPQLKEILNQKSAIIIPVGAMEWHDEHLPIGLDFIKVEKICELIAEKAGILCSPPISFGYPKHMSRDSEKGLGTFCPNFDALNNYILEIGKLYVDKGFKLIYFLSGHYERSQIFMLKLISRHLVDYARDNGKVILSITHQEPDFTIKDGISKNAREDYVRKDQNPDYNNGDHGGFYETSIAMYLIPELVHVDKIKSEYHDPARGKPSAEWGKKYVDMIVERASYEIQRALNGEELPPDFVIEN